MDHGYCPGDTVCIPTAELLVEIHTDSDLPSVGNQHTAVLVINILLHKTRVPGIQYILNI